MASTDGSDSDICYLPHTESHSESRVPQYSKWEKKSGATSSSRNDGDSLSRTSRSERETNNRRMKTGGSCRYRSNSRGGSRRYRSGSREFKMERRSKSRSSSPQPNKKEMRSRRSRSRSNSQESSKYFKYSRQSRNDSGSSSRERQRKYMKYGRRSNSSSGSSNQERRHRKYSRRSSSSQERNANYRSSQIKSRSSSRESRREDGSNMAINSGKTQRKGEKKTFFCPLCLIELNSEDTMNSHVNGVKHTKKVIEYNQKSMEEAVRGKRLPKMKVYQIPNPEAIKKKIPIRLHEKIKESADPVVGLKYIHEFIAVSDPEMEPYYECELCGNQGHSNMIFGHIMGSAHRQNFAVKIFKREIEKGQTKYLNMKQVELLDLAQKYNENNDKISSKIRTERNDENYPWPPGKAPWSIEKGGTGKAPVNARNWTKSSERKQVDTKKFSRRDVKETCQVKMNVEKRGNLPPPNKLGAPRNLEDAKKYIDLGSQMIKMAIDSNDAMEASEKMKLKDALEKMANEMEQARRKHESNPSR